MPDTFKVKVLQQKVFHDGTSMIVLNPKGQNPEVAEEFIAGLVADGFIEKPSGWKEPAKVKAEDAAVIADGAPSAPQADTAP